MDFARTQVDTLQRLIESALDDVEGRRRAGCSARFSVQSTVSDRMSSLPEGMYEKDRGSWFTAHLVVEAPGYRIDYDGQPTFVPTSTRRTGCGKCSPKLLGARERAEVPDLPARSTPAR